MKKIVVVGLHLGYWLLYLFLLFFILLCLQIGTKPSTTSLMLSFLHLSVFTFPPSLLGFYSFYFLLFDFFLKKHRIALFFLVGVVLSLGSGVVVAASMEFLHLLKIGPGVFRERWQSASQITAVMSMIALLNGTVALIIKGFVNWYNDLKFKEQLMQRNFETELALVKAQLSPHFLFNTLNNIDVLINKNTEQASRYLHQLSDILRFMLYETKGDQIALDRELAYLKQYIALQKIRTANPDFVEFEVGGITTQWCIAPMVLIPFVENAFKHASNERYGNAIRIKVQILNKTLVFLCENKINPSPSSEQAFGGLGNGLIQKRLALLYPDLHQLSITQSDGWYRVILEIQLTLSPSFISSSL